MAKQAQQEEETIDTVDPTAFASAIGVADIAALRAEFLPRYRRFRGELRQRRVGRGDNAVMARDMIDQAFQDRGVDVETELRRMREAERANDEAADRAASSALTSPTPIAGNIARNEVRAEIEKMRADAEAEISRRMDEADKVIAKMKEDAAKG